VVEHRRLRISCAHHERAPPDGRLSYHICREQQVGFVNSLLV
jgi:hypothetical protein